VARHVGKFGGVTPPDPKVIGMGTLNFKPFLNFCYKKLFGGPMSPLGSAVESLGHSQVRVEI